MRTLQALNDTVIVEVNVTQEKKTDGGIILPSKTDQESQSQALVISVGPEVSHINPGDIVIVSRVGGEVFYLDGRTFYALKKTDVFCVIKENN